MLSTSLLIFNRGPKIIWFESTSRITWSHNAKYFSDNTAKNASQPLRSLVILYFHFYSGLAVAAAWNVPNGRSALLNTQYCGMSPHA